MTDKVEAARKLLATMDAAELDQVFGHVTALKQLAPTKASRKETIQASADEISLYEEFRFQLMHRYGGNLPHFTGFCKTKLYPQFAEGAAYVIAFWDRHHKGSVVVRRSLVLKTPTLVLDWLDEGRGKFWPSISAAMLSYEMVIEHHFPGYVRCGMIGAVVESITIQREANHVRKESKQAS